MKPDKVVQDSDGRMWWGGYEVSYFFKTKSQSSCMHDNCAECAGTGIKQTGGACVHMLSCPCPKCSVTC